MSRKAAVLLSLAMLSLISACATSTPSWRKTGVSPEDALSALSECKYQVGLNKIPADQQKEMIEHCMQGKGFRWRKD